MTHRKYLVGIILPATSIQIIVCNFSIHKIDFTPVPIQDDVLKAPVNWYFRASLIILSFSNVTPLAPVGAGAKNGYLFRVG